MGAAPTVGPRAWAPAVGKGQGPAGSSPLTCEGQCGDSHSTVGFPRPCHCPVILSMAHHAQLLDAREASSLSVPGPGFLRALSPLACILQRPPHHLPAPGLASLAQLPGPSSQPLLHEGWVLTDSSSSFWKADDLAIFNSCAPGVRAPRASQPDLFCWHLAFVEEA